MLGLVRLSTIEVAPLVDDAPVIPPVVEFTPHEKLLPVVAVSAMFSPTLLQVDAVDEVETEGDGFTVTLTSVAEPEQPPPLDVGVTLYTITPIELLLGLVRLSVIVEPLPGSPPDTVPAFAIVQLKLLDVLDVNVMLSGTPLQVLLLVPLVRDGAGLTLTVTVVGLPTQPKLEVGTIE